jgi:hypothetical protein
MPVRTTGQKPLARRERDLWAIVDRNTQDAKFWNGSMENPEFIIRALDFRYDANLYYNCFNTALRDAVALGRAHPDLQSVIGIRIYRPHEVVPPDNPGTYPQPREAFIDACEGLYTYAAYDLERAILELHQDLPEIADEFRFFALTCMNDKHLRDMLGAAAENLDPDGWRWYSHVVAMRGDVELMTFMMLNTFRHVFDIQKGGLMD